jgi:DNA-binding transcriptional ArsR family regulator
VADNNSEGPAQELLQLRVLAHPLRLRMLSLLAGAPSSAAALARELGISQAAASYHLRQLHSAGWISLREVRRNRGGRERVYAYAPAPAGDAPRTDGSGFQLLAEAIAAEIRRRAAESLPGAPRLGVDAELWVEPSHWQDAVDSVRAAGLRLHEQARGPRTAGTIRTSMSAVLFPMTSPAPGADE